MFNNYVTVLKKYAEFGGRADRPEFWWFVLANAIIAFLLGLVAGAIGLPVLSILYWLATLLPGLAVGVRRLRDAGFSPWLLLLGLIPFGQLAVIVLWIFPSKK